MHHCNICKPTIIALCRGLWAKLSLTRSCSLSGPLWLTFALYDSFWLSLWSTLTHSCSLWFTLAPPDLVWLPLALSLALSGSLWCSSAHKVPARLTTFWPRCHSLSRAATRCLIFWQIDQFYNKFWNTIFHFAVHSLLFFEIHTIHGLSYKMAQLRNFREKKLISDSFCRFLLYSGPG